MNTILVLFVVSFVVAFVVALVYTLHTRTTHTTYTVPHTVLTQTVLTVPATIEGETGHWVWLPVSCCTIEHLDIYTVRIMDDSKCSALGYWIWVVDTVTIDIPTTPSTTVIDVQKIASTVLELQRSFGITLDVRKAVTPSTVPDDEAEYNDEYTPSCDEWSGWAKTERAPRVALVTDEYEELYAAIDKATAHGTVKYLFSKGEKACTKAYLKQKKLNKQKKQLS